MNASAFLKASSDHQPGPIVVLFGSERFLKQAALCAVCEIVLGSAGDEEMGLKRIAAKEADLATVVDELLTVSMWSARQLVLVEDADEFVTKFRAGLEKYLERPAKKSVLVLDVKSWPANTRLAKKAASIGLPLDCQPLKGADLLTFVSDVCRTRHGKKIDRQAAQLLVELAGSDLGLLDQELAKLAAYVGTRPSVDAETVRALVGGWKAETTWKMLDALRVGQTGAALQLLDKLLVSGEHPLKLLGGINYAYRPLAQGAELARQGTPLASALAEAGVKPFQVNESVAYLRRIGRPRAEQIYQWLVQADLDLKGGSSLPERVIMERLMLQLGGKA